MASGLEGRFGVPDLGAGKGLRPRVPGEPLLPQDLPLLVRLSLTSLSPKVPGQACCLAGRVREFSSRKFLPSQPQDKARKAALVAVGRWGPGLGIRWGSLG